LQRTWQRGGHAPWLVDQMSVILMQLATVSLPHPTTASLQRPAEDSAALAWFNQLLDVDRNNIFGQYMVGRIQYELHNYSQCEAAMRRVIALSQSTNVLSSAYTYLALSSDGQGDYAEARTYLLQAVSLDPKYRNNTAREELSGLR
jgi:tetratricopeptide (TPR) repeat protein